MYLWTVQRKEVIKTLIEEQEYYPDFSKSTGYGDMKHIYPALLENFNTLNKSSFSGFIFGFFGASGCSNFLTIEEVYAYLLEHLDVTAAFNFWTPDYAFLQFETKANISIMPIDFNDVVKLNIGKTKDIPRIRYLYDSIQDFNTDIYNIVTYMNSGRCNPYTRLRSFIEGHYPYLKVSEIVGVHPNFNYVEAKEHGELILFDLPEEAKSLKKIINSK